MKNVTLGATATPLDNTEPTNTMEAEPEIYIEVSSGGTVTGGIRVRF